MPWSSVRELPPEVRSAHPSERCQRAFMEAANSALADGKGDAEAFRIGHAAARQCEGGEEMNRRIRRQA
jgi:hypothetical protein